MSQPNPPRGTTVPATLAAIRAGLTAAINNPAVPVLPAMPTQWPEVGDVVIVAATVPGRAGVEENNALDTRTQGIQQSYDVTVAIVSVGDVGDDMATREVACGDLWDIARAWCDANKTLGGVVAKLRMGTNVAWVPRWRGDGPEMTVGFSIHVTADI